MKTAYIFFIIVLIAHVTYAGRVLRDTTEVPSDSVTMEDINNFIDNLYKSLKTEVQKIATKENLEKVQTAIQSAATTAQKGIEDLKAQAEEALKSKS